MSDQAHGVRGKIAVVTGGSRGIGAAIARMLAAEGAQVVICGRDREALRRQAVEISSAGGQCEPVICDVSRLEEVQALAKRVEATFTRVNILVNNAGIGGFGG